MAHDKTQLVQALARERLSTTGEGLRKPWTSAISEALSTALVAMIPIVPFFFLTGYPAVIVAAVVSLLAHFAVGAATSLITIRWLLALAVPSERSRDSSQGETQLKARSSSCTFGQVVNRARGDAY